MSEEQKKQGLSFSIAALIAGLLLFGLSFLPYFNETIRHYLALASLVVLIISLVFSAFRLAGEFLKLLLLILILVIPQLIFSTFFHEHWFLNFIYVIVAIVFVGFRFFRLLVPALAIALIFAVLNWGGLWDRVIHRDSKATSAPVKI